MSLRIDAHVTAIKRRTQTGLFAATIGVLLTVSIPDLKPNSQDISAFYLENIYQRFANSSLSDATIPSNLAERPAFSPPKYAIWVNSLWFLSLAISLTGATVATLGHQWAHRYITVTQHPRYTPDQRARIRTIFAESALGPYAIWGAGLSPLYLHFSIFLFLAGGLIYLFNLNHVAFGTVVGWVAIAVSGYAIVTVDGIHKSENLFYTPFSPSALRLYLRVSRIVFQLGTYIKSPRVLCADARDRCQALRTRYQYGFVEGKWTDIEEKALERSSEIDGMVIERTLLAMDDDSALGRFFDTLPGFFKSKLYQESPAHAKILQALYGFLGRTLSSDSISESVKTDRLVSCLNTAHAAFGPEAPSKTILEPLWSQVPQSVEMGRALTHWCTGNMGLIPEPVRWIVAKTLASVRERDDRWYALAIDVFDLPERALRDHVAHGDSVLLFILIHTTRQAIRSSSWTPWILSSHPRFNICDTLPALQNDFCALWNQIVLEAREIWNNHALIDILRRIRHSYIALHQGTEAAPTSFSHTTRDDDNILSELSSYPLCNMAGHRSDPATHNLITTSPTSPLSTFLDPAHDPWLRPAPLGTHALSADSLDIVVAANTIQGNAIASAPSPASLLRHSPSHSAISTMSHSYLDSIITRTDHIPQGPGSPTSFSAIASLSVLPLGITTPDHHATVGTRTAGMRDDSQDPDPPLPMEAFPHLDQSAPRAPGIVSRISLPEDS